MIQSFNSNDGFAPLRANSKLMEILYLYFTEIAANRVTISKEANAAKINALLIYMQENIHQKQQIEDFAKVMNLHPNYLIRLFRSNFGTSPMDYFNRLKVEKSKEMLAISQDSINVVADKSGFSTPYYFSTVFKAHTSYTPKDYRKQARSK